MKKKILIIEIIICVLALLILINKLYTPKSEIEVQNTTFDAIPSTTSTTTTKTTKKAVKTTKKKTTKKVVKTSNFKISSDKQKMLDYAHQLVLSYGWSEKDYQAIVNIGYKESNWNPNDVNKSSGACGIFQAYPCNKVLKNYPDYKTNWKTQIRWGLDYIKYRYKTPTKAWNFWQKHHWY